MFTKCPADIILKLNSLRKDHALGIGRCVERARKNGNNLCDQSLVQRYVHDHKLMGGELSILLRGFGLDPEGQGTAKLPATSERPGRMAQYSPGNLAYMIMTIDKEIEWGYLSLLKIWPIPSNVEDKVKLHLAFLDKLRWHIWRYSEDTAAPDPYRSEHPSKHRMDFQLPQGSTNPF